MSFCKNCGQSVDQSARFCSKCGFNLQQSNVQQDTPVTVVSEQPSGVKVIATPDPVYRATCSKCSCVFEYRRHNLGRRAWFPSGFVYCPQCRYPIRHRLEYEVKE